MNFHNSNLDKRENFTAETESTACPVQSNTMKYIYWALIVCLCMCLLSTCIVLLMKMKSKCPE